MCNYLSAIVNNPQLQNYYIRIAIEHAKINMGKTSYKPYIGSIIVHPDTGGVIGLGYRKELIKGEIITSEEMALHESGNINQGILISTHPPYFLPKKADHSIVNYVIDCGIGAIVFGISDGSTPKFTRFCSDRGVIVVHNSSLKEIIREELSQN